MSLQQVIEALLAHVPDNLPVQTVGEWWDRFDALDRAVSLEAHKLNLQGDLPQKEASGDYIGKTNLPGIKGIMGFFQPTGVRKWKSDLLDLVALPPPRELTFLQRHSYLGPIIGAIIGAIIVATVSIILFLWGKR